MSTSPDHSFGFDPGYGLTRDDLLGIGSPAAPHGFDAFWQRRCDRARAIDPGPVVGEATAGLKGWLVHDITYTSTDGVTIGGWLLVPRSGVVRRGLVIGHGYGGRETPDHDIPVEDTAILLPCLRGLSRSAVSGISPEAPRHVLHEIDDPDRYVIGGCVEDVWVAVSVLCQRFPDIENRIGYSGISFGGGIGALAIAFDERIDRGHLVVPTFGNRPLWLSLPTVGSADSVQTYRRNHPDTLENLRFFDAAIAASRIKVPMLAAVALFDPAVAPPCQFSIANALPASKFNEIFILDAGHFEYPQQDAQHAAHMAKAGQLFGAP